MGNPMETTEALGVERVLVVGDIMLDRYTWGRAERVSPEAPVLVVRADGCEIRLGGAGAVAALLWGLNSEVLLAGVVGDDAEGRAVRRVLDDAGIDGRCVLTDSDRPTTHKQRFLATVEQRQPHQILRVDHEQTHSLTPERVEGLFDAVVLCAELQPRTSDDRRSQEAGRPTVGGFGEVGRPAPSLQLCAVSDPAPVTTEGLKSLGDLRSAVSARSGDLRRACNRHRMGRSMWCSFPTMRKESARRNVSRALSGPHVNKRSSATKSSNATSDTCA